MLGQAQVTGLRTVSVDDGGNAAGPAGTASGALAELGARLSVDTDLRHGVSLLVRVRACPLLLPSPDMPRGTASGAPGDSCIVRHRSLADGPGGCGRARFRARGRTR